MERSPRSCHNRRSVNPHPLLSYKETIRFLGGNLRSRPVGHCTVASFLVSECPVLYALTPAVQFVVTLLLLWIRDGPIQVHRRRFGHLDTGVVHKPDGCIFVSYYSGLCVLTENFTCWETVWAAFEESGSSRVVAAGIFLLWSLSSCICRARTSHWQVTVFLLHQPERHLCTRGGWSYLLRRRPPRVSGSVWRTLAFAEETTIWIIPPAGCFCTVV